MGWVVAWEEGLVVAAAELPSVEVSSSAEDWQADRLNTSAAAAQNAKIFFMVCSFRLGSYRQSVRCVILAERMERIKEQIMVNCHLSGTCSVGEGLDPPSA